MITVIRDRAIATCARLTWLDYGLRIEWGYRRVFNFHPATVEVLLFTEYPELEALYDGVGWDLDELSSFLRSAEDTALPEAVLVLLTQKDINLLDAAGFSLA